MYVKRVVTGEMGVSFASGLRTGRDTHCLALLGFHVCFVFSSKYFFFITSSHSPHKVQVSISYRLFKQYFPRGTSDLNS